jgi:hypothetical protein
MSFVLVSPLVMRVNTDALHLQVGATPPASQAMATGLDYFGKELAAGKNFPALAKDEFRRKSMNSSTFPSIRREIVWLEAFGCQIEGGTRELAVRRIPHLSLVLFWYSDGLGLRASSTAGP